MMSVPENVKQVLIQIVPASIIEDIACFVFYDNHPRDDKKIDVVLCTKLGDVREYHQRELVSSVNLESECKQTDIRVLRNSCAELYYLVFGGDELIILSRKNQLAIHHKLANVSRYELSDSACSGQFSLKVFYNDSNIPAVPDDNFENFQYLDFSTMCLPLKPESGDLLTNLKIKLTEAKYTLKSNEQSYQDFVNLRHAVAFSIYRKINPNLNDSQFKDGKEYLTRALKIHSKKPWIKVCNKKVVIIYLICNENDKPLEDLDILLHVSGKQCIEYTIKLFEKTSRVPFWNELRSQTLKPHKESALVVVIDMEELRDNVLSKVEFNGVVSYKMCRKECMIPINDVMLSPLDTMEERFDMLCTDLMDSNAMPAILATTVITHLLLRHMKTGSIDQYYLSFAIFSEYLDMEKVLGDDNIMIHKKLPYHVLNGLMIVSHNLWPRRSDQLLVTVYSRTSSQVLALIHHIHNLVPYPIVTTTPNYTIKEKTDKLSVTNDNVQSNEAPTYNYMNYAVSMFNRTNLVKKYLDRCMMKMTESRNPVVRKKLGREIDVIAQGDVKYQEFKEKMREEAFKAVKSLYNDSDTIPMTEEMFIGD